jgi:transposase
MTFIHIWLIRRRWPFALYGKRHNFRNTQSAAYCRRFSHQRGGSCDMLERGILELQLEYAQSSGRPGRQSLRNRARDVCHLIPISAALDSGFQSLPFRAPDGQARIIYSQRSRHLSFNSFTSFWLNARLSEWINGDIIELEFLLCPSPNACPNS